MLTEAQKQGIVEIRINDPAGRVHELEDELKAVFGLRDVRVAHARTGVGQRWRTGSAPRPRGCCSTTSRTR